MKTRPILFSGEMVRAILDDRKSQTRRAMKPQPPRHEWNRYKTSRCNVKCKEQWLRCPYGQAGDRLWLRETWGVGAQYHTHKPSELATTTEMTYRASFDTTHGDFYRWRPSIHMPRWASRITLEVTDVRVERVQEITEADALAEGVSDLPFFLEGEVDLLPTQKEMECPFFIWRFRHLWDSIYDKKGFGFDVNPWCWCVTFKLLEV